MIELARKGEPDMLCDFLEACPELQANHWSELASLLRFLKPPTEKKARRGPREITPETKAFRYRRELWVINAFKSAKRDAIKAGRVFNAKVVRAALCKHFDTTEQKVEAYNGLKKKQRGGVGGINSK
jgi:hypothetical protein